MYLVATRMRERLNCAELLIRFDGDEFVAFLPLAMPDAKALMERYSITGFPVVDEIGRVVGEKMAVIAKSHQVLCVTHLPQVASQGHQQLYVEKYTDGIHTETRMRTLTDDERVQEIARLLAGENVSAHAIANARELLCTP